MQKVKFIFDFVTDWDRPNNVIAEEFGCDERTVRNARRVRGLPFAPPKEKDPSWVQMVLDDCKDLVWQELGNARLAQVLGCSTTSVREYRIKNNKPKRRK